MEGEVIDELKEQLTDTLVHMNSGWGDRLFSHYPLKTMRYVIEKLFLIIAKEGYVVVKKEDHSMGVQLANEYLRRIAEKDISPFEREEKYIGVDEPCPTCERIDCICDLKEHGFVVEKEERDEI